MKNKIIKILTLVLPLPIYLLVSASVFTIQPDIRVFDDFENIQVIQLEEDYFLFGDLNTQFSGGYVIYNDNVLGAVIEENDVVRVKNTYYTYSKDKNDQMALVKMNMIDHSVGYKMPMAIIISLFGALIVAMIVMGKMDMLKSYPRISALVALWVLALVFIIIDTIVRNLTGVFVISAITWSIYCIEHLAMTGKLTRTKSEKTMSDLERQLRGIK